MNSKITCKHCNKVVGRKGLAAHLRKVHSVPIEEYIQQHIEDFPRYGHCDECGKFCKRKYDAKHSISCSRKCAAAVKSRQQKGSWPGGVNPMSVPEYRAKMAATRKQQGNFRSGMKHTEEAKRKISETRKRLGLAKGKNNPMYGKTHTPEAIEKIYKNRYKNKLEARFCEILDDLDIPYTFQFFLTEDGVCKSYDFKITGKNILIEVDGDYWHGNPNTESHWHCVEEVKANDHFKNGLAISNGFEVLRFWEQDIYHNEEQVRAKLRTIL